MENNRIHILVVDDDDRIRTLLKEYLNENNYLVSTSENAENAKKKLTFFKFDLIYNSQKKRIFNALKNSSSDSVIKFKDVLKRIINGK